MSCRHSDAIHLLDTLPEGAAEQAALRAHLADCADCAQLLDGLDQARRVARSHTVEIAPALRARHWARLQGQLPSAPPLARRWVLASALAAGALALALWSRREPPPAVQRAAVEPPPVPAQAAPVEWAPAARGVLVSRGARYAVTDEEPALTALWLEEGRLAVQPPALAESAAVAVRTPEARVQPLTGRVLIERGPQGTRIVAEAGTVQVWPRGQVRPTELAAGDRLVLAARGGAAAAPAVSEDREAAPLPRAPRALPRPPPEEEDPAEPGGRKPAPGLVLAPPAEQSAEQTLREARAALPVDAPRAADLAGQVLERAPHTLEVEALAVLADAERRRGRTELAAELYGRLAAHPRGQAYAEEALLQRARIYSGQGAPAAALLELERAEQRFPRGPTAPERAALAAKLLLEQGDALAAARAVERGATLGRSLGLLEARLAVARALLESDRERARSLLAPVLDPESPASLRAEAQSLLARPAQRK